MNKVALVTGSSRGLGKKIIKCFAKEGTNVIINYNNSYKDALNLEKEIKEKYNVEVLTIKCDVSCEEEVIKMKDIIYDKFKKLDYLVNNAGICNDSIFFDKTKDDFLDLYSANLVGPFLVSKHLSKLMDKDSSIVNISSTNGIDTNYTYSADYDASKAALISLSNNLALELAPIRVNTVCPGWINTDMNKDLDSSYIEKEENKILLHRFADPTEIANVVLFLCSSKASYINKSVIRVDGGYNG